MCAAGPLKYVGKILPCYFTIYNLYIGIKAHSKFFFKSLKALYYHKVILCGLESYFYSTSVSATFLLHDYLCLCTDLFESLN